jgi:pimeloyl-ACP methyl ester carboxylesterase
MVALLPLRLLRQFVTLTTLGVAALALNGCATQTAANAPSITATANSQLVTEEFMVPSGDAAINLYVRNKRLASTTSFNKDNVVLFVHGATYPSETGFDLRLDGLSWMDVLAQQGFDVYMVDIRGYGKSTRPAAMDQPPMQNKPIADTDIAARDYAAAADFVRKRRGVEKINVLGHSWGTAITALYTTRHADKVNRLVLYAPVWLRKTASLTDSGGDLGAYRTVTIEAAFKRKNTGVQPGRDPQPKAWFDAWAEATFASDPVGAQANPKYVRAPNGSVLDSRLFWSAGKPAFDPKLLTVPTLLILAEWDADTPPYMAETLFPLLTNSPNKKLVMLSEGTHGIMNEVKRFSLFNEVARFYQDGLLLQPK